MNTRYSKHAGVFFIAAVLLLSASPLCAQQTTAFTYQGQLRDGATNANGAYTMTFKLYDAVSSGGQIGSTVTTSPTLANGLFSVNLDFGAGAFNGNGRKAGNNFILSFQTEPGKTYTVQFVDSLATPGWQNLPGITGDGTVKTVTNSAPGIAQRYYRLFEQ